MDLESECSALESVEDNEIVTPEKLEYFDKDERENNGPRGVEYGDHWSLSGSKPKDAVEVTDSVSSPPLYGKSAAGAVGSSPPATKKGYGLKKWRRIRRETNKYSSSNVDTSKILKRGLTTSTVTSSKPQGSSAQRSHKSDGSLSSSNAVLKTVGLGSGLAAGLNFAAGLDSENSEDRSSKLSTAASFPNLRHEIHAVLGRGRYMNKIRASSARNLVGSVQRVQQGKGQVENSKKPRGERVKIEKDNSHSSMESDLQSSNFAFMQGNYTVNSSGRPNGRSENDNGDNSDEAQGGGQYSGEELQTGYDRENGRESEGLSLEDVAAGFSWEAQEESVEDLRSFSDQDPLVESIRSLQIAQEELENELQKLKELGTGPISLFDGSTQGITLASEYACVGSEIHETGSFHLLHSEKITQNTSRFLETEVVSLKQNASLLESKLAETNALLKVREAKVIELECALKSNESSKEEMLNTLELQHKTYREIEAELEGLFKQKIEAEVEYLAISRTIQMLRVGAVDQVTLLEEQRALASEQAHMLNELGDTEKKAVKLKRQTEKLGSFCEDIAETGQVLKLQKRVCMVTSCLLVQSVLLFVVFAVFFVRLSPRSAGIIPT